MSGVLAQSSSQHVAGTIIVVALGIALAAVAIFLGVKLLVHIGQNFLPYLATFGAVAVVATLIAAALVAQFLTAVLIGCGIALFAVVCLAATDMW